MTNPDKPEIELLREKVREFSHSIQNPAKIEEVLLEACQGLLNVVEQLNSGEMMQQPGMQLIRETIHSNVLGILDTLSKQRKELSDRIPQVETLSKDNGELIGRIDPTGILLSANNTFSRYFSHLPEFKPGTNILNYLPQEQHALINDYIASLHPGEPVIHLEYPIIMPDQPACWVQWTGVGTFDKNGKLIDIQVLGQDITGQKQDQVAAQQHNRELNALHNATAALLTTLDPEALLSRILDAAISAVPAAGKGMIHLIAPDTGQLEMRASVGYSDPRIIRIRAPRVVGYVARAVQERTALLIHNLHNDPLLSTGVFDQVRDINSAIVAPLILNTQVLGAVSLESTEINAFSESDLRLLVSFAATATAAIHNAHLHGEVQKLATTDALTGLYNRRGFYELGQREVERARRYKRPLVAIMLDIDHFKAINDFYGYAAGDQVLQSTAKRCTENLRRIDILGRLGEDEFTILLPETDMFTATGVAERVRHCIANQPFMAQSSPVNISISLGVARATATTPDLDVLISRADKAMLIAKREGRNRVEYG